ncbi:hypothetical protein NHX12_007766 [Muraenolepis orangiensis]|uniref:G-protein coupled receptors family 1 profile domain-containing protein n=1 Tax=Muraenolepis orangiensis TaxID=630683 RepID=A0A9Q0DNH5_9TELE|nr:hypothetical protein NHX12_007766 [Muraenolepis orangiensis]
MEDYGNYSYEDYLEYGDVEEDRTAASASAQIETLHVVSVVIYSVSFALGLIGNAAVIWVTACRSKRSRSGVWLLNLAVADLAFVLFLPLSIDYVLRDFHWRYGLAMCKLNSYVAAVNMYASVLFLAVLSVDRYVSLAHADRCRGWRVVSGRPLAVVCGTWTLSAALGLPTLVFRDVIKVHDRVYCYNNFSSHDREAAAARHIIVVAVRTTVGFLLPFGAICTTAILLLRKVKRSEGAVRVSSFSKMVSAVILAFFLCWAPFHALSLMELSTHTSRAGNLSAVLKTGFPLATSLAFFNSCVNPMLYMFLHKRVRHILKRACLEITKKSIREINHSISASETSLVEDLPCSLSEVPVESSAL